MHKISRYQNKFAGIFRVLESFAQLSDHAGIDFDGDDFFGPLQEELGEVTSSGSNFKHDISGPDTWLVDHFMKDVRVDQNMLTVWFVEDHTGPVDGLLLLDHELNYKKVDIIIKKWTIK